MAIEKVQDVKEEPKKVAQRTEEVKPVAEKKDVSAPGLTLDDVRKLLAEQQAEFDKKLAAIKSKSKEESVEEIDALDDYMDEPATFFVFSTSYAIFGDKKRGKEMLPPNGKIKFTNVIRTRTRTNNGEKIISVSSHVTHSKSTAEWIRNCSAFGYEIFEDMNTVKSIDAAWAQQLVQSSNIVNNFSDHAVISRCKQEGIPISSDLNDLRRKLTTVIAKQNEEQKSRLLSRKLEAANIQENRIVEEGQVKI